MGDLRVGPIVRYVDQTKAAVWMGLARPGVVLLEVRPLRSKDKRGHRPKPQVAWTVMIGGQHYALPYVTGLRPGTYYRYRIRFLPLRTRARGEWPTTVRKVLCQSGVRSLDLSHLAIGPGPVFRTLAAPKKEAFQIAYGSCRKLDGGANQIPGVDVMAAFGKWMSATESDRLTKWPHLLMLMGDQIYADDVSPKLRKKLLARRRGIRKTSAFHVPTTLDFTESSLKRGKLSSEPAGVDRFHLYDFHEFGIAYEASWTEPDTACALANVATFMAFDDHEVTDDWNLTGGWVRQMETTPGRWAEVIADGLAAFFVYQGWGNFDPSVPPIDERFQVLRDAAKSGGDALEPLRKQFLKSLGLRPAKRFRWYFDIASSPPLAVLDLRMDRQLLAPHRPSGKTVEVHASYKEKLIGDDQLGWFKLKLQRAGEPLIVVSPLPVLRPGLMDQLSLVSVRPMSRILSEAETLTRGNSDRYENLRREQDMEGWAAFPSSFVDFFTEVVKSRRPVIALSGDVHYSYAISTSVGARKVPFVQLVSSALQNRPSKDSAAGTLKFAVGYGSPSVASIPTSALPKSGLTLARDALGLQAFTDERVPRNALEEPAPFVSRNLLFGNNIGFLTVGVSRRDLSAAWLVGVKGKIALMTAAELKRNRLQ